jgi:endonuclease YncB( thermonuclease family)
MPATGEALFVPGRNPWRKVGRITGEGKSVEGERVAEGLIGAMRRGNARGAKEPYCFVTPLSKGEARAR